MSQPAGRACGHADMRRFRILQVTSAEPPEPSADPMPERITKSHCSESESRRSGEVDHDIQAAVIESPPQSAESDEAHAEYETAAESYSFLGLVWRPHRFLSQAIPNDGFGLPSLYLEIPGRPEPIENRHRECPNAPNDSIRNRPVSRRFGRCNQSLRIKERLTNGFVANSDRYPARRKPISPRRRVAQTCHHSEVRSR